VITKDRVPVTNTVQATARVVVDGDRRYLVDVTAPIPTSKLPGTGQYSAFELHLGFMGEE
jgi:hypothetical protein